jgi:hypothetical protein
MSDQEDDDKELGGAFKRAWLLVLLGLAYALGMVSLAIGANTPEKASTWDMDGKPIVPASSPFADGYPLPFEAAGQQGPRR